jgi:hypothetical protein
MTFDEKLTKFSANCKKIYNLLYGICIKVWKALDGKKTFIATLWWTVTVPAIAILWPEHVPAFISKTQQLVGLMLSFIGIGHKAAKSFDSVEVKTDNTETK